MQFVTNFTQIKCQNIFLPKKCVNYDKLCFLTKQYKLYFHIINIHTQGYITLNKYIIGIDSFGLPKINLWATKCVTKRPQNTAKTPFLAKHYMFRAKSYPPKKLFYTDNIRASVTNCMSGRCHMKDNGPSYIFLQNIPSEKVFSCCATEL